MIVNEKTFADTYARMPDDDIHRLSLDIQSLVPVARGALRREMERRAIPVATIDWQAQSVQEDDQDPEVQSRKYRQKLILLIAGYVVFLGFSVWLFPEKGVIDAKKFVDFELKGATLLTTVFAGVISQSSLSKEMRLRLFLVALAPIALILICVAIF